MASWDEAEGRQGTVKEGRGVGRGVGCGVVCVWGVSVEESVWSGAGCLSGQRV